jgi:hypothetical protein
MSERIVAAACTVYGAIISLPPPSRHHTLLRIISELNPDIGALGEDSQGFLTSTGRYVGRREAAEIALESKQVEKIQVPYKLFSEDLW